MMIHAADAAHSIVNLILLTSHDCRLYVLVIKPVTCDILLHCELNSPSIAFSLRVASPEEDNND